jgi:hypothetical protein
LTIPEKQQNVSPINAGEHGRPWPPAVRQRCRAFPPPGEELQHLFPATSVQLGRRRRARQPLVGMVRGLQVASDASGQTVIAGPVADQAALHGLLPKIRDLGLPMLSVRRIDPDH